MDRIWAPWRMEFIKSFKRNTGRCVFCDIVKKKDDRKNLILYHGKTIYLVMNKYPYTNGHLLVLPYRHIKSIDQLSIDEKTELLDISGKAVNILTDLMDVQGFNCGFNLGRAAGAGIEDHIHFHIVPRWVGDTNFFPVLSDTRSMPEYLEETYDRLIKGFVKLEG